MAILLHLIREGYAKPPPSIFTIIGFESVTIDWIANRSLTLD